MICMICEQEVDTLIHHDPMPEYPVSALNCPLDVCPDCERKAEEAACTIRAWLGHKIAEYLQKEQ